MSALKRNLSILLCSLENGREVLETRTRYSVNEKIK